MTTDPTTDAAGAAHASDTSDTATAEETPDAALLASVAAGDREAFRALYDRFAGRVLAYVRMLTRDPAGADDVVQEVFLTVWRKASTYDPARGDVPGWLYTITRNKLVDSWRRQGPAKREDDFDFTTLLSTEHGVEAQVTNLSVRKALAGLKADQRQALEMAYFGGLTYEETALRLRLPIGTLKSRIRAGLASMRTLFEAAPPEPSASA